MKDVVLADSKTRSVFETGEANTTSIIDCASNLSLESLSRGTGSAIWVQTGQAFRFPANPIAFMPTTKLFVTVVPPLILRHFKLLWPRIGGFDGFT